MNLRKVVVNILALNLATVWIVWMYHLSSTPWEYIIENYLALIIIPVNSMLLGLCSAAIALWISTDEKRINRIYELEHLTEED